MIAPSVNVDWIGRILYLFYKWLLEHEKDLREALDSEKITHEIIRRYMERVVKIDEQVRNEKYDQELIKMMKRRGGEPIEYWPVARSICKGSKTGKGFFRWLHIPGVTILLMVGESEEQKVIAKTRLWPMRSIRLEQAAGKLIYKRYMNIFKPGKLEPLISKSWARTYTNEVMSRVKRSRIPDPDSDKEELTLQD
jgi:hypothetical protein